MGLKSIDELTAERDELKREVAELLESKQRLCEQIQQMEAGADLAQIEEIKADREALQEEVKELEKVKDWLYEIWKGCEFELDQIHSSKMWRVWMAYIAIRRALLTPFRLVLELPSLVRKVFVSFARFGGVCYLKTMASIRRARAWIRRRRPLLGQNPAPSATHEFAEGSRPRLLLVTPYHIYPANHGGGVRLINLVQRLSESCDLFLLVFSAQGEDPDQREALEPYCARLDFHRWVPKHRPDLFGLKPPNAQLFSSERVTELIRDIVLGNQIDIVQLEYAELGQYATSVPGGVPVILTEHDIAFRTQQRRRELLFMDRYPDSKVYCNTRTDLDRIFLHEQRACREADRIHVMSEVDGDFLSSFLPDGWKRIRVAPNGVDCSELAPPPENPEREGVLYVGNFQNLPNVDALEYLVHDVWPLLRLKRPNETLTVVGAHAEGRVTHFDGKNGVKIVGEVPEIRPYYHSHRVLAAPIRAASGTRLKILEAFAAGIPVVSTTVGAEGVAYEDGKHLVIADSAMKFAEALERLLDDDRQKDILTREGRKLAEQRYDWKRVSEVVLADYVDLLDTSRRSGEPRRRVGGTPEPRSPNGARGPVSTQARVDASADGPDISVIIPTFNGGAKLDETLEAVSSQVLSEKFEIICVDSGSPKSEIQGMTDRGAQVWSIDGQDFNHGLTRDLGASLSRGRILVFLNQDAVPAHNEWLRELTGPLRNGDGSVAAVQGGIQEVDDCNERFFWDSCGERFYFTSESKNWMNRYHGIGFSTVNCAMRRDVWQRHPFGWAPTMEDKKWQRKVIEAGFKIQHEENATTIHTHDYDFEALIKRCSSEGFGWRTLGERYSLTDMLGDLWRPEALVELLRGRKERPIKSSAEVLFPVIRPLALYWGNHFSKGA